MNFLSALDFSASKSAIVACAVVIVACFDIARRLKNRTTHLMFATIIGTALSFGLIWTTELFLEPGAKENPYAMAFALVLAILGWKALFGPWDVQTRATMLATFIFWVCVRIFADNEAEQQTARLIAAGTALVPALVWCHMFLKYHRERLSAVALMFMAGMVSTVPILFYDALVRRGIEMQFFLFRLKPENFNDSVQSFVSGHLGSGTTVFSILISTLIAFMFVGFIEEISKYWVLSRSAKQLFTSIDDVLQLSIMVAIGFSFAENIINPVYFTAFVQDYLFHEASPDFFGFLGNVLGRSVLTSMVHIVSTGVMGYFLGLAIFAGPLLAERQKRSPGYILIAMLHKMLRIKEVSIFRVQMMVTGLLSAILLHGLFNFLVTVPDILPGNPKSMADVFTGAPAIFDRIPLLMIPALLYVVGGFWLLTWLFMRKQNAVERGHIVIQEEVMSEVPAEA